ncbi:MAG: hypothetical protein DSY90_02950 [Deltaproteobacteria bacterium]|nr:MAG: hypothetical protein DSY90_02950 [Deltaproteobacteria bacterium]
MGSVSLLPDRAEGVRASIKRTDLYLSICYLQPDNLIEWIRYPKFIALFFLQDSALEWWVYPEDLSGSADGIGLQCRNLVIMTVQVTICKYD